MQNELISVIIPTYNRGYVLKRAIDSVLNQTHESLELIIVDDGSTDDTKQLVDSIDDKRLGYYLLNHKGACAARNFGIDMAKGSYIAFQDSDDSWRKNKLERQLEIMKEKDASIIFCSSRRWNPAGTVSVIFPDDIREGFLNYDEISVDNFVKTQCLLMKKECLNDVRFNPDLPRFQDWDLAMRLSKIYDIYYTSEILVDAYVQDDSISKDKKAAQEAKRILGI